MKVRIFLMSLFVIFAGGRSAFSDATFDKLFSNGKYEEAATYADKNIPPGSRDADMWIKIAKANKEAGNKEKALACYMVCWRSNPENYDALLGAATIKNEMEDYDQAQMMAEKAFNINPTGKAAWQYAKACIALDEPATAKKALEKVIQSDSSNVVANRELGNVYYNDKEYSKAIPLLKKSFDKKADAEVAYRIGKSSLETGKTSDAFKFLEKALSMDGSMVKAGLDLARTYYKAGKYGECAGAYKKIESQTELSADDYYSYAYSLEKSDNKDESVPVYKKAVSKFGTSTKKEALFARLKVAKADMADENYKDALEDLKFIYNADKKAKLVKDIHFLLADAYQGLNNTSRAIEILEKAIEQDESNVEAYARLADLYSKNKMEEKAKKTYEKLMSLKPNDPEVYLVLGQYNLESEKYQTAYDRFKKSNSLKKSVDALSGVALSAEKLGKWSNALDAAESALQLDDSRRDVRKVLYKALLNSKMYKEAAKHISILLEEEPENEELWKKLAECYEETNQSAKLIEADKKIVTLDQDFLSSNKRLAKHYYSKNDTDKAYKYYKKLSELTPEEPEVLQRLVDLAKKKGETGSAIAYLEKYLELKPKDAEAHRDHGDLLYDQEKLDRAMQAYEKAIEIDSNIKGFYKRYAEIVLAKGQEEKVITAMEGLIKSGEADFGTYNTLAEIYKGNKQYEKAIEYYNEALSLKPQETEALTSLAECQKALGKISTAIITYEQAVMMDSEVYKPYKSLAELYLKQGKEDKAINTYQKYLDKGGKSSEISLKVGNYLYEQEEYKEALKYLEDVSGKAAKDFLLRYRLMRIYHMKKEHEKVASIGEELRDRNPSSEKLKNILRWTADAYEGMEDMENALDIYDQYTKLKGVKEPDIDYKRARLREKDDRKLAIEIYKSNVDKYPDDVRSYVRLGRLYSKDDETLSKATSILEKAASMATDRPQIWGKIAEIYGKLGNKDKELEAYEKYLKAEPKNFNANLRVGQILMNKEQISESMIYLETANSIKPDNLEVMEALSRGYVKTKRIDEAITLMDKVKEKDPKNVKIRQHLFKLHMKKGNTKKALNEIEELVKKDPGPKNMYMYARTLFEMEKYDDALDKVEDILAANPENLKALMLKAKIRMAEEEYEKAIESYKEVLYIDSENASALAGRGMAYLKMEKFLWADKFFRRALDADKECVDAYIGMALIAKARDKKDEFRENVKKAVKLDPYDPKVKELKKEL